MNSTDYVTISLAAIAMFGSWAIWVTMMLFELKTKISLIKQEITVLKEVKDVLEDIRGEMHHKRAIHGHS